MAPKTPAVVDSSGSDASDVEGADFIPGDEFVHRQQATVYDAVAGRVVGRKEAQVVKHSTRDAPLPPDEVLFRRAGAPQRYAEHDIYYANERQLGRGGRAGLPDSDLLKAVHSYASKFYAAQQREQQIFTTPGVPVGDAADPGEDERTMDETALLAFGILLEEESRQLLGRKGDMVFTEGAGEHDGDEGHEDEDEDGQAADDEQLDYGTREMLVGSTVGAPRRRKRLRAEANESGDATA